MKTWRGDSKQQVQQPHLSFPVLFLFNNHKRNHYCILFQSVNHSNQNIHRETLATALQRFRHILDVAGCIIQIQSNYDLTPSLISLASIRSVMDTIHRKPEIGNQNKQGNHPRTDLTHFAIQMFYGLQLVAFSCKFVTFNAYKDSLCWYLQQDSSNLNSVDTLRLE